jgi:hypothetical protein
MSLSWATSVLCINKDTPYRVLVVTLAHSTNFDDSVSQISRGSWPTTEQI